MVRIFVYGDSNIRGDNTSGPAVPYRQRWFSHVRRSMAVSIVTNGISGRVAGNYRLDKPEKNGKSTYLQALKKAGAVDLIIIALGTNDLQVKYNRTAKEIIDDLLWYRTQSPGLKLLYLLPSIFATDERSGPEFTEQSLSVREELAHHKDALGWSLTPGDIPLSDGLHFSADGHKMIAELIQKEIGRYI